MAEWERCKSTKSQIDRAGNTLRPWWVSNDPGNIVEIGQAWLIAQNWRSSHAYPLNSFQVNLRQRASKIEGSAIVAQRQKRISSVLNKLAREPTMKLSQMQDLGGCRAILSSIANVDDLYQMYDARSRYDSESSLRGFDYIRHPKRDGYRGIHVVGRYTARIESRSHWNKYRIEIQLRTRLQHAFATAVETVTTFTRQPLKFGAGPESWQRFFALMGSALSLRESTPLVPGTPSDPEELATELRETARELQVRPKLKGWASALRTVPRSNIKSFKWLLLALDLKAQSIQVTGFANRRNADATLAELESGKPEDVDAVLVWVPSARDLRTAYPNYYADTQGFLAALDRAVRR